MSLMPGFTARNVRANGLRFHTWIGGDGPPLVLVHGYPQSGIMWRKVAPTLAQHYTVVVPDLRGYGDSDKPRDGFDKKTMASDIHGVMAALGHARYRVVGHDREAASQSVKVRQLVGVRVEVLAQELREHAREAVVLGAGTQLNRDGPRYLE